MTRVTPSILVRCAVACLFLVALWHGHSLTNSSHLDAATGAEEACIDSSDPKCLGDPPAKAGPQLVHTRQGSDDIIVLARQPVADPPSTTARKKQSRPGVQDVMRRVKDQMTKRLSPRTWSPEEKKIRRYVWRGGEVQPHESLERFVAELDEYPTQIYEWLRATRPARMRGEGIGLGLRDGLIADIGTDSDWPTFAHSDGSRAKSEQIQEEQATGAIAGMPSCEAVGQAFRAYAHFHQQTLAGHRAPRYLESYIPSNEAAGGIADRLLGTATAALYAIITRRALVIHWDNPMPFDLLFDSPLGIDWSYPYFPPSESAHPFFGAKENIADRLKIYAMQWKKKPLDGLFSKTKWLDLSSKWVRLMVNRGVIIRSFEYPTIGPRMRDLGFEPDTTFSCLVQNLFRPRPAALDFIAQYTSLFALPTVFSVGIQIRTGDASMKNPVEDAELNTVDRHLRFFTCAAAVAARHALPTQRIIYYLVSDSVALKEDALRRFPDRVVVSGLEPRHTDPKLKIGVQEGQKRSVRERYMMDAMGDSVVEAWTLAETDFKIITEQSGFGKIATFMRGQEGKTITIFPEYDKDIQEAWRRAPGREQLDCSSDDALVSFKTLADQWSLG